MGMVRFAGDESFAALACRQSSDAPARGSLFVLPVRSRFFDRLDRGSSGWLRIWLVLTVMWSMVIAAMGWINLPRAQHIPHNPGLLTKLPNKASLILSGGGSKTWLPRQGALVWSDAPIIVTMLNGARLTLPASSTHEQVALVKDEYRKLLDAEASAQTGPYVLGMIVAWLLPCSALLVLGLATGSARRLHKSGAPKDDPESAAAGAKTTRHGTVRPAVRAVRIPLRLVRENDFGIERKPCSLLKMVSGSGAEHEV